MKKLNYSATGLVLGVALAILDCFADAFLFYGGSLADQFFSPTPVEIWMRSVLIAACVGLGVHFQRMAGKREAFQAALKRSHAELEQRVQERTSELTQVNRRLEEQGTERRQVEEELWLKQFAIEHSSDPIYWIKADGGIAYANQAACRALGYGAEEFLSISVCDFDPDCPREAWPAEWKKSREAGTSTFEGRHRTKQGRVFPVEISTNFLEYEGQEYIWAYVRDITKHKEAEEQAARFSRVLENSLNEIYLFDAETLRFIEVNRGARENLGYSLEELLGLTPLDLKPELTPETFAERLEPLRAGVEEKLQFTTVHRRKDGTRYPIEVHLQLTDDIAPVFVAIILDITERERADEAVRESEERFRQLASSINQVFWLVSLDQSRVFYISPAYESVWGRSCESLYGNPRSWSDTIHPDDRASVIEALSSEGPSGKPLHYRIIKPGGEIRWIESVAYPVTNEAGEVYRIAGLAEDITERRRAEEELRLSAAITENMAEGINLTRVSDGEIVFTNRVFDEMFGYESGELSGRHASVLNAEGDKRPEQTAAEIISGVESNRSWTGEVFNAKKDGTKFWTRAHVSAFDHGTHGTVWLTVQEDITERKQAEEALRKVHEELEQRVEQRTAELQAANSQLCVSEAHVRRQVEEWQQTFDAVEDAILVVDENGKILRANRGASDLCPEPEGSLIGRHCYEVVHGSDQPSEDCPHCESRRCGATREGEIYESHRRQWLRISSFPLPSPNEELCPCVLVIADVTERKRTEEALKASEERYHDLYDNAPDMFCSVDAATGRVLECNLTLAEATGYARSELIGRHISELYHPDCEMDRQIVFKAFTQLGEVRDAQLQLQRKDGGKLDVSLNVCAVRDEQGNILHSRSIWRDITERKRTEEALRESEERFRRAVVDAPVPMMIHAEGGEVLRINTVWTDLTGYRQEEIPTLAEWTERAYGSRQEIARERIDSLYRIDGRVAEGEYTIATKDGRTIVWEFSSSPLGRLEDGRRLVLSIATDVTERKRVLQALRESEARTQAVLDAALNVIISIDERGIVQSFNSCAERDFGYAAEEIIGQNVKVIMPSPDRDQHDGYLAGYLNSGRSRILCTAREVVGRRKDGTTFPLELSVTEARVGDWRVFVGVLQDLTERKLAVRQIRTHQEELAHMSRLSTMGEMATGLAHELNQPLAAIVNYTQGCVRKLRAGGADTNELISILDEASDQAKRAGDIISRIRHFVRKKTLERVEVNVAELVRQVTGLLRNELQSRGVKLEVHIGNFLGTVQADRIQLQQVLVNLITNSMEAMEQIDEARRTVTLTASCDKDGLLAIRVADNGCGLPQGSDDEIFEPFYTTKSNGTGMGLAISRTIIEAHGGRLRATDNANGGCTFHFSLPTHTGASAGT